jgi:hypothetical protein
MNPKDANHRLEAAAAQYYNAADTIINLVLSGGDRTRKVAEYLAALMAEPSPDDLQAIQANLASLNEIMAEVVAKISPEEHEFVDMVRTTLRDHSWAIGFTFQDPDHLRFYPGPDQEEEPDYEPHGPVDFNRYLDLSHPDLSDSGAADDDFQPGDSE